MKISELIKNLEAYKNAFGDVDVVHWDSEWGEYYRIDSFEMLINDYGDLAIVASDHDIAEAQKEYDSQFKSEDFNL